VKLLKHSKTKTQTCFYLVYRPILLILTWNLDFICFGFQNSMWPIVLAYARTYAPYIVMPVAGVVGFVGEGKSCMALRGISEVDSIVGLNKPSWLKKHNKLL
jgi:hypothetical protein